MEIRTACSPADEKHYDTARLRKEFLIDDLFKEDEIKLVYSHIDRIITGSAVPVRDRLVLTAGSELRASYFLERREMGVINIGGDGVVTIDGREYKVAYKEGMYIGMGSKDISFASADPGKPARFYINSAPAHMTYPTVLIKREGTPEEGVVIIKDENKKELGSLEESNHRVINKYILPGQVETCQLEMGMTELKPGSVWNADAACEELSHVLAKYKIPSRFFLYDRFPVLGSGKVDTVSLSKDVKERLKKGF